MSNKPDDAQPRWLSKSSLLFGVIVGIAIVVAAFSGRQTAELPTGAATGKQFKLVDALVLGIVEGVTEYLPVSSTGHLLLTERALGLTTTDEAKSAADSYAVIIQIGAILAVLGLYRRRAEQMALGLVGRSTAGLRLAVMLVLAFLPAALIGLALEDHIKQYLFGPWPIVLGWFVGGVAILVMPRRWERESCAPVRALEDMQWRHALTIGLFQVLAMWPGVSRSLATIAGGLIAGLGLAAAVEFSFLLGLITLGAATVYELLKEGPAVISAYGVVLPIVGIVSSFVAAWVSVEWLVNYLRQRGLALFGYYRILLALVTAWLLLRGIL